MTATLTPMVIKPRPTHYAAQLAVAIRKARLQARREHRTYYVNREEYPWGGSYPHISPFRPMFGRFVVVSPLGSHSWKGC